MCIIKRGLLKQDEFNTRCHKVFISAVSDEYNSIVITEDNEVVINLEVYDDDYHSRLIMNYIPDMSSRPQALAYLLGERNNFND